MSEHAHPTRRPDWRCRRARWRRAQPARHARRPRRWPRTGRPRPDRLEGVARRPGGCRRRPAGCSRLADPPGRVGRRGMPSADYGPNHVAAERFLDALDHLGTPEVVTLGAAGSGDFGDGEVEAREALRAELRGIAERAGRLGAIRAMSDEVQRWATSVRHWLPAGVAGTPDARGDMTARMSAVRGRPRRRVRRDPRGPPRARGGGAAAAAVARHRRRSVRTRSAARLGPGRPSRGGAHAGCAGTRAGCATDGGLRSLRRAGPGPECLTGRRPAWAIRSRQDPARSSRPIDGVQFRAVATTPSLRSNSPASFDRPAPAGRWRYRTRSPARSSSGA